jgi:hypothetical protein
MHIRNQLVLLGGVFVVAFICKRRSKSVALVGSDGRSKSAAHDLLAGNSKAELRPVFVSSLPPGERNPCCEICILGPKFVV